MIASKRRSRLVRHSLPAVLACAVLASVPACHPTSIQLWKPAPPAAADAVEVERFRDVTYYDGKDADSFRHRLDLYLPKGKKDYPVVVLVHGGAWMMGDNRHYGLYSSVGAYLASRGVGVALPNYRLSPGVKHPEHVKDVARAVAWVRANIARRGGDPERLFLAGHSAGGHLVSLLATDETYLKAEGMTAADLRGVISVSGVYRIPTGKLDLALGGDSMHAFRLDAVAPLRGEGGRFLRALSGGPGLPLRLNVYGPAFGNDPKVREQASPLSHARPGRPPFLIVAAEKDLPTLTGPAGEFHRALKKEGCESTFLHVPGRNHNSVIFSAIESNDPVAKAMLDFIERHGQK